MKKGIILFILGMALTFTACNGGANQEALQNEVDSESFGREQKQPENTQINFPSQNDSENAPENREEGQDNQNTEQKQDGVRPASNGKDTEANAGAGGKKEDTEDRSGTGNGDSTNYTDQTTTKPKTTDNVNLNAGDKTEEKPVSQQEVSGDNDAKIAEDKADGTSTFKVGEPNYND